MNILLVLIPLSLVLVALGVWAFFWSVDHDQFDDLDTPALIPLSDDVAAASLARNDMERCASEQPPQDCRDAAPAQVGPKAAPPEEPRERLTSHVSRLANP